MNALDYYEYAKLAAATYTVLDGQSLDPSCYTQLT